MPVDLWLGVVFVLGIAFTTYMLIVSWGGAYWVHTTVVAVVMCGLALLRGRGRPWTAAAGVAVAALGVGVSLVGGLPQEPSPMAALALAVLVGSSLRTLPVLPAVAVSAGGVAVIAFAWVRGYTGVTSMATLLLFGGLIAGTSLRAFARVRGSGAPSSRSLGRPRR
ncbi:metal transporter [Streptomyces sp. ML-6]|uniref:metal transporter n=1 Tax=Streptomyces sp. ML-6 TaxID=2982693 RepID=UPI0024BF8601|nr:metal transporter [Streptomyces sp. ML-6]MDK0519302.1 metal transporter [Streptomyces sp. ML-6]